MHRMVDCFPYLYNNEFVEDNFIFNLGFFCQNFIYNTYFGILIKKK